jgi:hypothetical protein
MARDISDILREWAYEPGQINVRLIEGADGDPKIQMRLDLGMLQMEVSGRPDGQRPHGYESLLEYYEAVIEEGAPGPEGPEEMLLSAEDCRQLRDEAVQYYHRYISMLVLGEYEGVLRDTSRNLRVLDLCRDYAEGDEDQEILEQFRPYLLMMRARALASQAVHESEPKAALFAIDDGLELIRGAFEDAGASDEYERSNEVALLRGMKAELVKKLPASQKTELRQRLREAIAVENYELAAILRDELKNLRDHA